MAETAEQLKIHVRNAVGKLAEVTDTIKAAGLNIQAACAWVQGEAGYMYLITDDNDKACGALTGQVENCQKTPVVTVTAPDEVGAMNALAKKLADAGVGINLVYATTAGGKASRPAFRPGRRPRRRVRFVDDHGRCGVPRTAPLPRAGL